MSPSPYLKLNSCLGQNANRVCRVCVLRAKISFPFFQRNYLKCVRNRWKSLLGAGGRKRRFQYLSPFQNRTKTRPLKEPVKNKIRGAQHSRLLGYSFWLVFCFGFPFNLEWLEKMKIFSLCWKKRQTQNALPCLELRYFSPGFSGGPSNQIKLGE